MGKEKGKMALSTKILISLAIGIVVGIIVHTFPEGFVRDTLLINGIFNLVGQIFLRSIMMLVVPLVFISLVNGASSIGDIKKLGRVGGKTVLFYLTTTAIAVIIALALGAIIKPGVGLDLGAVATTDITIGEEVPLVDIFIDMVPKNPIKAMAEGNMLQIIVFAILTGLGLSILGEKAGKVKDLFLELNELVMKLVELVMYLAPIGVFGLIGKTFGEIGIKALLPVAKYVFAVYLGLAIHMLIVYGGLFKIFTNLPIKTFYKKYLPAMSVAFSTASSGATLPVSLDVVQNDMGVAGEIASFTLPLGSTINMDGTAIMQGVATFFVAQVYNVPLTMGMLVTVVLTATLASIGTAGVPGAGSIMLSMVLQSIGLPLEGMALIMGIDRLVDMGRTATNVTGDAVCTIIIAQQEGQLDEEVFLREKAE